MCEDHDRPGVRLADHDLDRVRALRRTAVEALTEANRILARYAGVEADSIDSVTISLRVRPAAFDEGVPPVWVDPCVQYNSGGACAYLECDPPGETRPCVPVTLPE